MTVSRVTQVHRFWLIAWIFQLVLIGTGATVSAQDATTQSAGGGGGDPFTIGCGSDRLLAGVQGNTGDHFPLGTFVNSVQALCVSVDAGGEWIGNPMPVGAIPGTNKGTLSSLTCPSGQAVSAIGGRSGIYLDQLEIQCAPVGEYGHLAGQSNWVSSAIGGTGGNFFGPFPCPSNKPGKGFTGRAHDWIDRIALVCNYPSTPPAAASDMFVSPNPVIGGNPVHGTVTLNATAPAGGTSISISRQVNVADISHIPSNPLSSNPITVPAGQRTGSFIFNTIPVAAPVTVGLAPSPMAGSVFRNFSILPPSLTTFSLTPMKTSPGGSATGAISLNGKAPLGGLSASLTSSVTAAATVPPTALIAQGQSSATFPITVASANQSGCSVITVSGLFTTPGGDGARQAVLVAPIPPNAAFTFLTPVSGASSLVGTASFPSNASSTRTLTLTSSNPSLVGVPSSVMVAANATSANFTISVQSRPPTGLNCAVITAADTAGHKNSVIVSIDTSSIKRVD
jgi:hypothetical protein